MTDITYIRLQDEFVLLAVILDACSRRVIGWALERTLEDELTLAALRMALSQRAAGPGLVHHSDRGSQYASTDGSVANRRERGGRRLRVMDPKSWTQKWPFLRWSAALKIEESQCPERVRVTHPA